MNRKSVTRRRLFETVGLGAGISLIPGCCDLLHGSQDKPDAQWRYVRLDAAAVAAEAYRRFADGGCMYGLFAGFMTVMAARQKEPFSSFPLHMMRYGGGGGGDWGSLCGALNGGAAVIGLFEQEKQRRQSLIAQLFSWYEATELPTYAPKGTGDSSAFPKNAAGSVLCHVSANNWSKMSGNLIGSEEMKERCRRLTADVAGKTAELLNANLATPCKFAGLSPGVQSCVSCHGQELHDSFGKMQCDSCHRELSTKHPTVLPKPTKASGKTRK